MGKIKGLLAKEKEKSEDLQTDLEISYMKIKVKIYCLIYYRGKMSFYLKEIRKYKT